MTREWVEPTMPRTSDDLKWQSERREVAPWEEELGTCAEEEVSLTLVTHVDAKNGVVELIVSGL